MSTGTRLQPEPELGQLEPEPEPEPEPELEGWRSWSLPSWSSLTEAAETTAAADLGEALVQAGIECIVPKGVSQQPDLTLFEPSGGQWWGCMPVLRHDWEQRLHVKRTRGTAATRCTPTQLATAWCVSGDGPHDLRCWERARAALRDDSSLLHFEWRAHDAGRRLTCPATQIGFVAGAGGHARSFAIAEGIPAIGTAYRRAKGLSTTEQWKAYALANCYHTEVQSEDESGGRPTTRLHLYRHGVAGFGEPSTPEMRDAASSQLQQLLQHATAAQLHDGLPRRVVSINLMDHTLESDMIRRQHDAWQDALARAEVGANGSPLSFAELQLPCNTDQAVLGWTRLDYERHLNFEATIQYLGWIVEDVCTILHRLLLPQGFAEGEDSPGVRAGPQRWVRVSPAEQPPWLETLRRTCLFDAGALAATVSNIVGAISLHPDYKKCIHAMLVHDTPAAEPQEPGVAEGTDEMDIGSSQRGASSSAETKGWQHLAEHLPRWTAHASEKAKQRARTHLAEDSDGGTLDGTSLRQYVHCVLLLLHAILLLVHNFAVALADSDAGHSSSGATSARTRSTTEESLIREIERSRAAIHCLDVFCMVELGLPSEPQRSESPSDRAPATVPPWRQEAERSSGGRRQPFARTTSLATITLLNHVVGCAVFCNCKSGIDRTGLFCGMQIGISGLWENLPAKRWEVLLTAINFHLVRGRAADQTSSGHFEQPIVPTADESGTQAEASKAFLEYFSQDSRFSGTGELPDGRSPGLNEHPLADLLLVADAGGLQQLFPMLCALRNSILVYLADCNARISFLSCGVRGMKYKAHAIAGQLLPPMICVAPSRGKLDLTARKWAGMRAAWGSKGTIEVLTSFGEDLLCDASSQRKS